MVSHRKRPPPAEVVVAASPGAVGGEGGDGGDGVSDLLGPVVLNATIPQAEVGPRVRGRTFARPLVWGTAALWQGKKAHPEKTHRWTCYVRGPDGEDVSGWVDKVTFTLHPSFEQPVRELTVPPFEVTEEGWGEFEIGIAVDFKAVGREKGLKLRHTLRLYPTDPNEGQSLKKPVVVEHYDEVLFVEPNAAMIKVLEALPEPGAGARPEGASALDDYEPGWFPSWNDNEERAKVQAARDRVRNEIEYYRKRLRELEKARNDAVRSEERQRERLREQAQQNEAARQLEVIAAAQAAQAAQAAAASGAGAGDEGAAAQGGAPAEGRDVPNDAAGPEGAGPMDVDGTPAAAVQGADGIKAEAGSAGGDGAGAQSDGVHVKQEDGDAG